MARYDDTHEQSAPPQRKGVHSRDPRCSFKSGPHRCPLPATWYPEHAPISAHQTYNPHGWCAMHDEAEKRNMPPWEAQEQLKRMNENGKDYAYDLLAGGWKEEREKLIQQKIDEHPEWQRQPDESSTEYRQRMLAICKKLGKGVRARYRHG